MFYVSFESVIDRLKECTGISSDAKLAHEIGLSPQALGNRRKTGSLPYDHILNYAVSRKINLSWLFSGVKDTSPNSQEKDISELSSFIPQAYPETNPLLDEDFVLVPRYDVEASTGYGSLIEQEEIIEHLAFKREWIYRMGLNPDNLSLISVRGDSMEPTLGRGDLVLVDRRVDRILDNAIYVLWLDGLRLKRIQQKIDGSLTILSDNPAYQSEEVDQHSADQLKVVGRAVWVGKRL